MKSIILSIVAAALSVIVTLGHSWAQDERQLIDVPEEVRVQFLAQMRKFNDTLDDLVTALAKGDFKETARVAEMQMGFGFHRLELMQAQGASKEEIAAALGR